MERIRIDNDVDLFFRLLNAGLWGTPVDAAVFCGLRDSSWKRILKLSQEQTVTALVFNGISALPEECMPPEDIMINWVARVEMIERRNAKMASAQKSLLELFHERGLNPTVMKGLGVAKYYSDPSSRECGDIDLYFHGKEFKAAALVLKEEGIGAERESDGSLAYMWEGIAVEHHPRFLDISNPFKRRRLRRLEERYGTDSPMMTLLLLSTHILKHALGKGIGLRQFCDMARAWNALSPELVDGEYEAACRYLGISRWIKQLHDFMGGDAASSRLLEIVLEGGNFGRYRHGANHPVPAFLRNFAFAMRTAPAEYISLMLELSLGRLRRLLKNK